MSFTYEVTDLDTSLAKVRLEIGDTVEASALFQDEELEYWIDKRADNVLLAAADAADALARRFAQDYDFSTDNQSFKRSQRAAAYRKMADDLRKRAHGMGNIKSHRVDAYSDDKNNRDGGSGSSNSRRHYFDLDRIP